MADGIVGAGKAEVGELRRAGIGGVGAGGEEDILRLDVAMDDADEMEGFECPGEIAAGGDLDVGSVRGEFREGGVGLGAGLLPPGKTLEAPRGGDLLAESTRRAVLEMGEEGVALGGGESIVEELLHRLLIGAA